jgi:hypothetical protein
MSSKERHPDLNNGENGSQGSRSPAYCNDAYSVADWQHFYANLDPNRKLFQVNN